MKISTVRLQTKFEFDFDLCPGTLPHNDLSALRTRCLTADEQTSAGAAHLPGQQGVAVGDQDSLAALLEAHLEVVVPQDLNQRLPESGNF